MATSPEKTEVVDADEELTGSTGPEKEGARVIASEESKSKRKKEKDEPTQVLDKRPQSKDTALEHDWDQNEKQIFIRIKLGPSAVAKSDIDFEITDSDCQIKLKDGRQWYCKFHREVTGSTCHITLRRDKLLEVKVTKKVICEEWSSLEINPVGKDDDDDDEFDDGVVYGASGGGAPALPLHPSPEEAQEPEYIINLAKHNWFEKGPDTVVVHIYVKEVDETDLQVIFEEERLTVKFKTRDTVFLNLHSPSSRTTLFSWTIQLRKATQPEQCRYRVTRACIDIILIKKVPERWGCLEAPSIYTASPGRQTSSASDWMPMTRSRSSERKKSAARRGRDMDSDSDNDSSTSVNSSGYGSIASTSSGASGNSAIDNKFKVSTHYLNKPQELSKPTCMVSPLSKNKSVKDSEIVCKDGFTGLDNLGNTCFMNSVLQVLSNTKEFKDYFLDSSLREQINVDNPLGTGGHLALSFAVLMKVLWSGKYHSYAPSKLKNIVASKASQFTGFAQHDAQEFMAFLLDGLHEDLNRVKNKPYIESKDYDGRPDEVIAEEAWSRHKKRNDSFIVDFLQGQFKSKLVCPECSKVSITFDPFMHLSVPLPKKMRLLSVYFMYKEPYKTPKKYIIEVPQDGTVDDLKAEISKKTGIATTELRVYEAHKSKIQKLFTRGSSLCSISNNDFIFVQEVLSEDVAGEKVIDISIIQRTLIPHTQATKCSYCKTDRPPNNKLKRCTKCYRVGYCDQSCQKRHWPTHKTLCKITPEPVGMPFIVSIPESKATYSRLCNHLEGFARYSVDTFQPPIKDTLNTQLSTDSSRPSSDSDSVSGDSIPTHKEQGQGDVTVPESEDSNDSKDCNPHSPQVIAETPQPSPASSDIIPPSPNNKMPDLLPETQSQSQGGVDGEEKTQTKSSDDMAEKDPVLQDESQGTEGDSGKGVISEDVTDNSARDDTDVKMEEPSTTLDMVTETTVIQGNTEQDMSETATSENKGDSKKTSESCNKGTGTAKAAVPGQQQGADRTTPLFFLKPASQFGQSLSGPQGERLGDKGDVPLDLSAVHTLAMDWKNNEKMTHYVLVQSKSFEYEDDESMERTTFSESKDISLHHCLRLFTEPEKLAPEEAWYCPNCKEHREATKTMSVWRLPMTLIIQLKRFSFKNMLWRDKIDKMVDYPIRGLNLSNYCSGPKKPDSSDSLYDLYGVVNHMGGILGGHYTAYARLPSPEHWDANEVDWRLFDDSRVSTVSEKNVVTRSAYLLFYRKRMPPTATLMRSLIDVKETFVSEEKDNKELEEEDSDDMEESPDNENTKDNKHTYDEVTASTSNLGYTDMDDVD
ncbi:ubiquitin carboxyl-terminal hydrolase 19-like [Glandiceps talaboti]